MHITTTDGDNYHKRELWLDEETCVSWLNVFDFRMRIGSTPVTMAGIGWVGTDWQHRNKGYMRILFEDTLTYIMDQDYAVSALFGVENLYNKWDYTPCIAKYLGKVKTRNAEAARNLAVDSIAYPVKDAEMIKVVNLYNQHNATRSGSLVRSPKTFTKFERGAQWGTKPDPIIWKDSHNNVLGYALVDIDSKAVRLSEVTVVDDSFFATILYHLAMQAVEKRCESIELKLPPDHPFAEYTVRYGVEWKVDFPRYSSGMMRIINLPSLIEGLIPEFERRLTLSHLRDFTGSLSVETDLGMTHLRFEHGKVFFGHEEQKPLKLVCPQETLMQLLLGYRSIRDAVNAKNVQTSGDVIPLLNVLFPKGIPYMYMADHF